jgi:hypothetical protein
MFEIGDTIIGLPDAPYVWTGEGVVCKVIDKDNSKIIVNILPSTDPVDFYVESKFFGFLESNVSALLLLNNED